jgi:hypothetical protein
MVQDMKANTKTVRRKEKVNSLGWMDLNIKEISITITSMGTASISGKMKGNMMDNG